MGELHVRVTVGLLLLLTCTLVGAAPTPKTSVSRGSRRATAPVRREEELRRFAETTKMGRTVAAATGEAPWSPWGSAMTVITTPHGEKRRLRRVKTDRRGDRPVAPTPRNHRKMDKYLTHITGRLYFSPKCRKHASHVYHQTRDCTILAYFKRCARLLTRLASSPMCTGG
ncbi:aLK and LTK ligand 2a [Hippocampus comes]|uniref:aLK and LTK ligand 2a n=1 Tax=Hippocampus comes TaxID=109280 RepID=UPI00094E674F|nr:PREDICTED: protein FAM150B [Hippocampus comes]